MCWRYTHRRRLPGRAAWPHHQDMPAALREVQPTQQPPRERFEGGGAERRWWTLGVLCLSLLTIVIASTSLNVALLRLVERLNASPSSLHARDVVDPRARLPARRAPYAPIAIWAGFAGVGLALGGVLNGWLLEHSWWGSIFLIVVAGGMGMATAPSTGAIIVSLPLSKAGVGSAVNDTTRELRGALGVAVVGSVLVSIYRCGLPTSAGPAHESLEPRSNRTVSRGRRTPRLLHCCAPEPKPPPPPTEQPSRREPPNPIRRRSIRMIVITTPTGLIGQKVLDNLLDSGEALRVIAHDPSALPAGVRGGTSTWSRAPRRSGGRRRGVRRRRCRVLAHATRSTAPSIDAAYLDFTRPAADTFKTHGVERVVGVSTLGRGTPWAHRAASSPPRWRWTI